MLSISKTDLLSSTIKELPFSKEFRLFAEKQQLKTLEELLKLKVADFIKLPGFSYHILQEYIQFLEERQLANLLIQ